MAKNWWRGLKTKVRFDEPLNNKTTIRIGGEAQFFIEPENIAELKEFLVLAKKNKIPVLVLGAGSNVLVADKGIAAVVIRLSSAFFREINFNKNHATVGSGLMLCELIKKNQEHSFSGAEFLAGVPGTLGGALAMNAGAWGKCIAELVEKVIVMDFSGNLKTLSKEDFKFSYRKSSLAKYIILSACLKLKKNKKEKIRERIKKYLENRRNMQDNSYPNAGCVFKNPAGESAGRMIDLCGLKGRTIGGASVSKIHANFILNKGRASSADVLKLISLIKKRVRNKFNINLEPEIKLWGTKA